MKPLFVLIAVFCVSALTLQFISGKYDFPLSGRIAMCAMLCFTAIGYSVFTKGMAMVMPACIPLKILLVYLTGVLEVVLGIGLLIPYIQIYAAFALIGFFIALLPANICSC